MMPTDKTILIQCSECPGTHMEEGFEAILNHILENHPEYNGLEANSYALRWMEEAYDREEKFLADYYEERKLDRMIAADIEHQEHQI